ncbi:MAG: class I SAM-dependent methyltransferase [Candidatus Margulisbacteria bacterium]|nr:class I SAM-dependent methyltransferase [Candidatus Margulisiibacteriota bacterium]
MEYTVKNYYTKNLSNYDDYRALGWETQEAQTKRFEVLLKNADLKNKTLLDIGCGLGDLYGFLKSFNIPVSYLGTDIMSEMIEKAKQKYPRALFIHEDILNNNTAMELFPENSFDVVFSSGIFNLKTSNSNSFLRESLIIFKHLARTKIVFNLLSNNSQNKEDAYCYYEPKQIDTMLRQLKFDKNSIHFIQDYLPNDFTVIIDLQ